MNKDDYIILTPLTYFKTFRQLIPKNWKINNGYVYIPKITATRYTKKILRTWGVGLENPDENIAKEVIVIYAWMTILKYNNKEQISLLRKFSEEPFNISFTDVVLNKPHFLYLLRLNLLIDIMPTR